MEEILIKRRDFRTTNGELLKVYYRAGTSDERVLVEVIDKACYRKKRTGFDVLPGEHWLDLGANIGAFAVYCRLRGAEVTCFEPDKDCFALLKGNAPWANCINAAVTVSHLETVELFSSPNNFDHYRGTILPTTNYKRSGTRQIVTNKPARELKNWFFDGVKMDIEGAEGLILDRWEIPKCSKLIMEYHTSKDSSVANLQHRIKMLWKHFQYVHYPPEFENVFASGAVEFKAYFDRLIWAWEPIQ